MSSFYGMGGGSAKSGSNLNNDYNKIRNTPVTNIGTTTLGNFVVLSDLDEKHYNLTGYYKLDSDDSIHQAKSPLDVLIYKDSNTGYKVIQYFTTEDATVYLNTRVYDGANLLKNDKIDLAPLTWGEF